MSGEDAIFVEIVATRGSTPRDAGTAMKVTPRRTVGTIGGGALEHKAIGVAQEILSGATARQEETWPLGPGLGQCCGGAVTLRFTREPRPVDEDARCPSQAEPKAEPHSLDLWIWGAGHVGRAIVQAAQGHRITWLDTGPERFPDGADRLATIVPGSDLPRIATRAPVGAHHLILTYSHDIDLGLCDALLHRGFASCGLIGSDTKWARFRSRLSALGHDDAQISRIACPIGDKSLGKRPREIAQGVVAALRKSSDGTRG